LPELPGFGGRVSEYVPVAEFGLSVMAPLVFSRFTLFLTVRPDALNVNLVEYAKLLVSPLGV
jgi:hypothetical protein